MNHFLAVAIVQWAPGDGVSLVIGEALSRLGHKPSYFKHDGQIPVDVDVIFTFAPYGDWLQIPRAVASISEHRRPLMLHWNFEGIPNPELPWRFVQTLSSWRSWLGALSTAPSECSHLIGTHFPGFLVRRMHKYRYIGDYHRAHREGWLDLFLETSQIYAEYHCRHGLPASFVPWGTHDAWYADLGLERDIDVLWIGKRRTRRRSRLLDQIRRELSARGVEMYVIDGIEQPLIYGDERTRLLNRAKVVLNLLPTWWDNAFPFRFNMVAGNRSLVVSEPFLKHCDLYEPGKHYVSVPTGRLTDTILHYLQHEDERSQIVENAYALVTTNLTLENSVRGIMELVASCVRRRQSGYNFSKGEQYG